MRLAARIESGMSDAIKNMAELLRVDVKATTTHCVLTVDGWNDSEDTRQAIAEYLVGLRAAAIDCALAVRADLADSAKHRLQILKNVEAIVGSPSSPLSEDAISTERNPWIAEALSHLLMAAAAARQQLHPPGRVLAVGLPHVAAKDHGLDVVAIYWSPDGCGLSIVETKAYPKDPNQAIGDAAAKFREINEGKHDLPIRQSVQTMRAFLSAEVQSLVSPAFWEENRSYLPNPHYDSAVAVNWTNGRRSLEGLLPDKQRVLVLPNSVQGFHEFFDDIAKKMWHYAASL